MHFERQNRDEPGANFNFILIYTILHVIFKNFRIGLEWHQMIKSKA